MIPMLVASQDIDEITPSTEFGRRVLAAAIKCQLIAKRPGVGEHHYILGRVTANELTAFALEFAKPINVKE